jgi:ABC-2 type transport system permease protein
MTPISAATRSGVQRGLLEFRQSFVSLPDILGMVIPTTVLLVVMVFMRDSTVGATGFSLGTVSFSSVLGMTVVFNGMLSIVQQLTVEREDGTLLRAKAVPNGMFGFLVGKVVSVSLLATVSVAALLIPGMLLFDGLALDSVGSWITLIWVLVLGLIATMPLGAVLGSMFENPRNISLVMLPIMGLVAISGIFVPITEMGSFWQFVGQVFPMYWLGLGMRSAVLPDSMSVIEIGGSWRHLETVGVLGLWAVIGLVLAPAFLRRMARRESGSSMEKRREKALQRVN